MTMDRCRILLWKGECLCQSGNNWFYLNLQIWVSYLKWLNQTFIFVEWPPSSPPSLWPLRLRTLIPSIQTKRWDWPTAGKVHLKLNLILKICCWFKIVFPDVYCHQQRPRHFPFLCGGRPLGSFALQPGAKGGHTYLGKQMAIIGTWMNFKFQARFKPNYYKTSPKLDKSTKMLLKEFDCTFEIIPIPSFLCFQLCLSLPPSLQVHPFFSITIITTILLNCFMMIIPSSATTESSE